MTHLKGSFTYHDTYAGFPLYKHFQGFLYIHIYRVSHTMHIHGFLSKNTWVPSHTLHKYRVHFLHHIRIQGFLFYIKHKHRGSFTYHSQTHGLLHIPYTSRGVPSHTIHKHMGSFTYHTQIEGSLSHTIPKYRHTSGVLLYTS